MDTSKTELQVDVSFFLCLLARVLKCCCVFVCAPLPLSRFSLPPAHCVHSHLNSKTFELLLPCTNPSMAIISCLFRVTLSDSFAWTVCTHHAPQSNPPPSHQSVFSAVLRESCYDQVQPHHVPKWVSLNSLRHPSSQCNVAGWCAGVFAHTMAKIVRCAA